MATRAKKSDSLFLMLSCITEWRVDMVVFNYCPAADYAAKSTIETNGLFDIMRDISAKAVLVFH